jgi:hypothetical protein
MQLKALKQKITNIFKTVTSETILAPTLLDLEESSYRDIYQKILELKK